jgi:hypothetical protein
VREVLYIHVKLIIMFNHNCNNPNIGSISGSIMSSILTITHNRRDISVDCRHYATLYQVYY